MTDVKLSSLISCLADDVIKYHIPESNLPPRTVQKGVGQSGTGSTNGTKSAFGSLWEAKWSTLVWSELWVKFDYEWKKKQFSAEINQGLHFRSALYLETSHIARIPLVGLPLKSLGNILWRWIDVACLPTVICGHYVDCTDILLIDTYFDEGVTDEGVTTNISNRWSIH